LNSPILLCCNPLSQLLCNTVHRYISRWKAILSAYNAIRGRLLYSEDVLQGTNLCLPFLNETTIKLWYKNATRRNEITTLLQGLQLPTPDLTASSSLPAAAELPVSAPPVAADVHRHVMADNEDRRGQATVRGHSTAPPAASTSSASAVSLPPAIAGPSTASDDHQLPVDEPSQPVTAVSRTTAWRKRKKEVEQCRQQEIEAPAVARKVYTCRVCNKPMSSPGHTQFKGQRYCSETPGIAPQEEWLRQKRSEAEAKSKAK
jgi:hypothetical protein